MVTGIDKDDFYLNTIANQRALRQSVRYSSGHNRGAAVELNNTVAFRKWGFSYTGTVGTADDQVVSGYSVGCDSNVKVTVGGV